MKKLGLDTNVLVRYLTQDDEKQFRTVCRIIDQVDTGCNFVLSSVTLCELVWVLESAYDYQRGEIAEVLDKIMNTAQFEVHDKDIARKALADYREKRGDFADYYLGYCNRASGATQTLTFDKKLDESELFSLIRTT